MPQHEHTSFSWSPGDARLLDNQGY